jgi:hypothetical protein
MNRRSRTQWICIVAALIGAGVVLRAAEGLRITPMVRDNQVLVSFELTDAYTDAVRDAIASGLRTTFTYELELRTLVPAWVDRTIVTTVVTASDHYDNLTRRHTLSRIIDGHVAEVSVTETESAEKAWLTTRSRLPLCDTSKLDPSRDYYVRISARPRPLGSSLLGWANSITGQAKFTYNP